MNLRLGTRGSALALAQAHDAARRLTAAGATVEIVIISTVGDRVTDRAFSDVGAFGVFVREIEAALLDRRIDVAVHSYKDLPSRGPDGLVVAAVPERVDPADVLLVRRDRMAAPVNGIPLAPGAVVGTSAMRRRALLHEMRPDLTHALLRGNVPTRVRALADGTFDAIVLAAAGLARLAREDGDRKLTLPADVEVVRLDPSRFVPAPSQGAIALQVRAGDAAEAVVARVDDASCRRAVATERVALFLAEGGCTIPFGAWCTAAGGDRLSLVAALGASDGTVARSTADGTDPAAVAAEAWEPLAGLVAR
ncbi:MAG: hydroxymethylbilane synthase [Gemmatimonadota bacterium]|nr:hydroxymethylbilane synthase [Gemmatimonadota bacterium]